VAADAHVTVRVSRWIERVIAGNPSALTLLVARVLTDDANLALPSNDLAVLAPNLDRRSDFHRDVTST